VTYATDNPRVEPVESMPLAEQAREHIRASILDGTLRPGERLTIEQLAADLRVSRTPVREALKALEQDGLVHLLPHRGAIVESVAQEEVHHRFTLRAMLEGFAAELACQADAARIAEELEAVCSKLEAIVERDMADDEGTAWRMSEVNREFHGLIWRGSGSRTLIRLLETLRNPVSYTHSHWADPERRRASLTIHREIVAAFRSGNPRKTRKLMERHILDARDGMRPTRDETSAEDLRT
jgi:DNA-binding GntR family transcriptional regulator